MSDSLEKFSELLREQSPAFFEIKEAEYQMLERLKNSINMNDREVNITIDEDVTPQNVDHPTHYGGKDNPYEAIKVIEAWGVGLNLGNTLKYISRSDKKDFIIQDLEKAAWYLNREIENLKNK